MINRDISDSKGFAKLSPEAAVLFTMLIPHYNAHGKLNGGPGYLKDEVCPRISYLTIAKIPKLLTQITNETSVKWFESDGRHWIHSTNFLTEHQKLSKDRLGRDLLPTYSGVTRKISYEGEGEGEGEDKGEDKNGAVPAKPKPATLPDDEWMKTLSPNPAYQGINLEVLRGKLIAWCDLNRVKPTRKRFLNWLNREDKVMSPREPIRKEKDY